MLSSFYYTNEMMVLATMFKSWIKLRMQRDSAKLVSSWTNISSVTSFLIWFELFYLFLLISLCLIFSWIILSSFVLWSLVGLFVIQVRTIYMTNALRRHLWQVLCLFLFIFLNFIEFRTTTVYSICFTFP